MNPALPALLACRECAHEVSADAWTCPNCGAPRPAQPTWDGAGYEWKSTATWMGSPLVHIAFGTGRDGRLRTARGIVAVGQQAVGVLACGIIARGVIAIGVLAFGFVSLGVVALALVCAAGVNAIAPVAFGVTALGYLVGGVGTIGWKTLFSVNPL